MILDKALLDIPIKDAAAHIFRRPFLFVNPTAHMLQIATFLAIGPQIYADGLIVINETNNKPTGRIGSKHIISNIINTGYPECLETTAFQIMDDDFAGIVDVNSPMGKVLEVFDKTRFAFVVIVSKGNDRIDSEHSSKAAEEAAVASLSIRDILPLIAKMNINIPIKDLCSPLISVDKNTSIRSAIDFMIKKGIRNIGIMEDSDYSDDSTNGNNRNNNKTKLLRTINDRKILEFLLSDKGKQIMRKNGIAGLAGVDIINHLDMISTNKVKYDATTSEAAELLTHIDNPCLILENEEYGNNYSIVTPWDIVMKTMK